jgi:hypothetical protein
MQRQRFARHAGLVGDCHRTCIAMILNMNRDDVPHFMAKLTPDMPADHPLCKEAEQAEIKWLRPYGLVPVNVAYPGETPLETVLELTKQLMHGAPVILGCRSGNGCNHSVVIWDGRVYNPNDGFIAGPMNDGYWWLTIYSVGPNWDGRPNWLDRLREWFR